MSAEDKTKVWVEGHLVSIEELQEKYGQLSIAGTPSKRRILEILAQAKKPLTRQDIAKQAALSSAQYTATILKRLVKEGYVMIFEIKGSNFKYYLLTEKGTKLLK